MVGDAAAGENPCNSAGVFPPGTAARVSELLGSRRCTVGMPDPSRSSPRDRASGARLQTAVVGAIAALVLACSGFLAYRAAAALDDAYRWTGEAEAASVARGFASSLTATDF